MRRLFACRIVVSEARDHWSKLSLCCEKDVNRGHQSLCWLPVSHCPHCEEAHPCPEFTITMSLDAIDNWPMSLKD